MCLRYRGSRSVVIFSVIAAVLIFCGAVEAQETAKTGTYVVVGSGSMQGNVSAARERAIADGLVAAVARMTEEILQLESVVENFQRLNNLLLNNTAQYIQGYKVLTEASSGKFYRVVVEVKVSGRKIADKLSEAGIIKVEFELPTVILLIAEQNIDDVDPSYWWGGNSGDYRSVSESAIQEAFRQRGFKVIDSAQARRQRPGSWTPLNRVKLTDQEVVAVGAGYNADVVIIGSSTASISSNVMGSDMKSFRGLVQLRAIRVDTGKEINRLSQDAVVTGEDDVEGGRESLQQAGTLAGVTLAGDIESLWQQQAQAPSKVEVVVEGTSNLVNFVRFRKALSSISGVETIQVKEMKPNQATLLVDYKGKAKELASALMRQTFESFGINIFETTENALKVALEAH